MNVSRVGVLGVMAFLWALPAHAQTAPNTQTPHQRARTILHEPAYRFCNDSSRIVRPDELRYCGYVDVRSACPAFAQACDNALHRDQPSCSAPNNIGLMSSIAQKFLIALVLGIALTLIVLLIRAGIRARQTEVLVDPQPTSSERESRVAIPTATSSELFARALDANERGDDRAALFALYGALLRKLDETGEIRIEPAFTNGDYVRQCAKPELKPPLKETVREVERVRFGGATATRDAFDRLRPKIEPIVRAIAAILMVAWIGNTSACSRDGRGETTAEASIGGDRAVRELLQQNGMHARRLGEAPEDVHDVSRVLVINSASIDLEPEQWSALLNWVERGGRLVIAGSVSSWPDSLGIHANTTRTGSTMISLAPDLGGLTARLHGSSPALEPSTVAVILASYTDDKAIFAVKIPRQSGAILAMARPELITNAGIAVEENADATVALFRTFASDRDVYFVEDPEGSASNPLSALQRAGILPLVLQGLLALVVFYLMIGRHFGTPRDTAIVARRSFAEHVRAVGSLYARARTSRAVLRSYSKLVIERIRERVGAGRGSLAEGIAARTGESREDVEQVFRAVESSNSSRGERSHEAEDLRLIKRLNDWFTRLG